VHELINIPSINLHPNKLDSVFSFTVEEGAEKEIGGRGANGEEKSPPHSHYINSATKYLIKLDVYDKMLAAPH
jgi:hypothetical protein